MTIRAVTLTASRPLFFSPSNSPQILSFSSSKPFLSSKSLTKPPILRIGRRSRAHGFTGASMAAVELEPSLVVKKKAAEIYNELKGTSIFLVGRNCAMKTNVGKLLADALKYYYFDSDSLVEQAAGGESTAESFRKRDEQGFCDSETEVLKQLSSMGRLVVCAGDGAVQSSTNLAYMRHGISFWIDVPLDMLANEMLKTEVLSSAIEPTSESDSSQEVLEGLCKHYVEMREGYRTTDATVSLQKVAAQLGYEDLESVTPQDMAMEVLKEVEKLTRAKKMMEAAARPF